MIDKHTINMVIRQLSDEELAHERKQMNEKARQFQSLAARLNRETKRRHKEGKSHVSV